MLLLPRASFVLGVVLPPGFVLCLLEGLNRKTIVEADQFWVAEALGKESKLRRVMRLLDKFCGSHVHQICLADISVDIEQLLRKGCQSADNS